VIFYDVNQTKPALNQIIEVIFYRVKRDANGEKNLYNNGAMTDVGNKYGWSF